MDGFQVMPMLEAAKIADIIVTATGDKSVIAKQHFEVMKDGAILANTGHFNVEIEIDALRAMATETREAREFVEEFTLPTAARSTCSPTGASSTSSAAEGHPAR